MILCSFLKSFKFEEKYELVDLFAGQARLTRLGRAAGMSAVALDLEYSPTNPRTFDLNEEPGFVLLD